MQEYRNKRLGHHDKAEFERELKLERYPATLQELDDARQAIEDKYNALGIGVGASFGLASLEKRDGDSQMIRTLDAIALQHQDMGLMETEPEMWQRRMKATNMTEDFYEFLCRLRKKYDLSPPPPMPD